MKYLEGGWGGEWGIYWREDGEDGYIGENEDGGSVFYFCGFLYVYCESTLGLYEGALRGYPSREGGTWKEGSLKRWGDMRCMGC